MGVSSISGLAGQGSIAVYMRRQTKARQGRGWVAGPVKRPGAHVRAGQGKTRAKSMARGILSGVIWGTVVSVAGLSAVSVLAPDPAGVTRPMPDPGPGDAPVEPETTPLADLAEGASDAGEEPAPADTQPAPDDISTGTTPAPSIPGEQSAAQTIAPPEPVQEPEATPDTGQGAPEIAAADQPPPDLDYEFPEDSAEPPRPSDVTAVSPDATTPALDPPDAPQDSAPRETTAAPPPSPTTGDAIAGLDAPGGAQSQVSPMGPAKDAAPDTTARPALRTPERESDPAVSTESAPSPTPPVAAVESPPTPPVANVDAPSEATSGDSGVAAAPDASIGADAQPERPQVRRLVPATPDGGTGTADTGAATSRPMIGRPAASLTDRNPSNSARLPSIGAPSEPEQASQAALGDATIQPPLQRFAAEVESDPSLPRLSIVMIDTGTGPLGPETLDGFPFPVTFAIDPAQPGARERMAAYRTLGYEVAVLVDLPQDAQPTDVEQLLAGALASVPEAVALIEAPGGGLQDARAVTEQATRFVAESGHGLVFLPNGLNTAEAIARREDVPAVSILRDFDGDGQDARTKRRFLDGAAFRARQDGSVVMLGRLTPDTLSALVLWSLQDRASSVAMVPVSAILTDRSN